MYLWRSVLTFALPWVYAVGSRDHPPLSKDPLPASWDSDWLAGWPIYYRETGQEQAKAHHSGDSWEAGERPQGGEICGVLSPHAGNLYIYEYKYSHTWFTYDTHDSHLNGKSWEKGGKEEHVHIPPGLCTLWLMSFCSAWPVSLTVLTYDLIGVANCKSSDVFQMV